MNSPKKSREGVENDIDKEALGNIEAIQLVPTGCKETQVDLGCEKVRSSQLYSSLTLSNASSQRLNSPSVELKTSRMTRLRSTDITTVM